MRDAGTVSSGGTIMRATRWLLASAGIAGASYATYVAATYLRYGRVKRTGDTVDELADRFMPAYEVCDRQAINVAAPADVTLAAAKELDFERSRIIRAIFHGRELILRSKPGAAPAKSKNFIDNMTAIGWGVLADTPGREIVMGAVTKPWEANPVFHPLAPEAFAAFSEPDHVKIVWTLRADPTPDGGSIFHTETRAIATDPEARRKFRLYWSFLSPGIILIRSALLPKLKADAERRWQLDGDDLLPVARAQLTHAVTIDAPPKDIWPWLLQMGGQRAGWYSWDVLDNGGIRSADHIIPELQRLAVGDVIPAKPTGNEGFEVLQIKAERAIVLRGIAPDFAGTWAFVLEPLPDNRTRLITRYRAAYPPSLRMVMKVPVLAALHGFMERKQL